MAATEPVRLPEPQTRGYVMNLIRNLTPNWLELEIRRISQAGFNLLLFPALSNGWTLFQSEAARGYGLGSINPLFKKWDPLAEVTMLARQAGLAVWAYARPYNFHPRYSIAEHKLLKKYPEWRLRAHPEHTSARTRRRELWNACPINPAYRRYLADVLSELAAGYPIDGLMINFDGMNMKGGALEESPFCFCPACRQAYYGEFQADLLADAQGGRLERVRAWQLEQMHEHFIYLRHRILRSRRSMRLICRARPDWRDTPDHPRPPMERTVLMDWPTLLASGAIEEVAVDADEEPCTDGFSTRLAADYAYLGDRILFLPIIAVRDLHELAQPLAAISRYPIPGFLGEFQSSLTEESVRFLRETYFAEDAPLPESEPVRTAAYLLSRVRLQYEDQPMVHDLLFDMLRLLRGQMPEPNSFSTLQMLEQNIHGLEQFVRRGRLGRLVPERAMRDLGLARRFVRLACMGVRA